MDIFSLLPLERFNLDRPLRDEKKKEEEKRWYRLIPRSFSNWLQAFAILASVIGEKAPEHCSPLFCYMDAISEAYHVYGRQAWLRYDEQFRQRKAVRPSMRWDHKDIGLWLRVSAPTRPSVTFQKGLCFAFNEGECKFGQKCKFKHECSSCGGVHGAREAQGWYSKRGRHRCG